MTRDWVEQYKSLHPLKIDFSIREVRAALDGDTLSMVIAFTLQRKGMCSRADCFINATVPRVPIRPETVEWAPQVGRPADYLPSGTVGQ